jgi:hypothetical protein
MDNLQECPGNAAVRRKIRVGVILDGYDLPQWQYMILQNIAESEYASIRLVILMDFHTPAMLSDLIRVNRKKLLYMGYMRIERFTFRRNDDAYSIKDSGPILADIPDIKIQREVDDERYVVKEDEVNQVQNFELDVILQLGSKTIRGNLLKAARYGIWSYLPDGIMAPGHVPAGCYETLERRKEQTVMLMMVTDDQDPGIVLYQSSFPCYSSFIYKNCNDCFLRASLFVPRVLKRLHDTGELNFIEPSVQETSQAGVCEGSTRGMPDNEVCLKLLISHFSSLLCRTIHNLLFRRKWMLEYYLGDEVSTSFQEFKKMTPPKDLFWADPHIVYREGRYYIFIEEFSYHANKGHISCIEMEPSGRYSAPVKVLDEPFHLSFPFVFEYNGTFYMLPETPSARGIHLYQCIGFPSRWKFMQVLVGSVEAADSVILHYNNKFWLFTNIADPVGTSIENELYLFYSDDILSGDWKPHPLNPIVSDVKKARMAGKIVEKDGRLFRPSQCDSPIYGYGIRLNEIIRMTEYDYQETEMMFIEPDWDKDINGIHTFNHENRLTVIDCSYETIIL